MKFKSLAILALAAAAAPAPAVTTSRWKHTSEADFAAGTLDRVVATNLGDLKLSRSVRSILPQDARVSSVHAMAEAPDGTVFAATGPEGVLLKIKDGSVSDAATFGDNVSLFSLRVDRDGRMLVGTGGENGEVYRIDKPGATPKRIFSAPGVHYVWSIFESPDDGTLYLATGPTGQLWSVGRDGSAEIVYDGDENNLMCVAGAPGGGDLLYVGTDPNGLLLRVNRRTRECFVVYDAAETEIGALAFDRDGRVLAATSQALPDAEADAAAAAAATEQTGRPGGGGTAGGVPIEAVPPENPQPPQLPDPPPGEPKPIPKYAVRDDERPEEPGDPSDAAPEETPPTTGPAATPQSTPNIAPADVVASGAAAAALEPAVDGNAIYRVDRDGFVTELFRADAAFFALLALPDGSILAGTGGNGLLYQIRPADDETVTLARVDAKQVLCLHAGGDGGGVGRVYLGCANRGDIVEMTAGFAATGTFTSPVLDAGQISRFGQLRLQGSLPTGATLTLSTRSGNVADPAAAGWSSWTDASPAAEFIPVGSPPARFLQYRLTFGSDAMTAATPVVSDVEVAYQVPNLPPAVSSVRVTAGDVSDPNARAKRTIAWESADPNDDPLRYAVLFRATAFAAAGGDGEGWVTIKDDLEEPTLEWDTRTVADGRYEVRVVASDERANAAGAGRTSSRVSDPIVVDNTPPAIGDIAVARGPGDAIELKCVVVDRGNTVEKLEYAINGLGEWRLALPSDMIGDSPKESYAVSIRGPADGPIALRATDSAGNQGYATVAAPPRQAKQAAAAGRD